MEPTGLIRKWQEGSVDKRDWHFKLYYGTDRDTALEKWTPVALVGPPTNETVDVEFLLDRSDTRFEGVRGMVIAEVEFIIGQSGCDGPDDWKRAVRHAGSIANAYSDVQWGDFMPELDTQYGSFLVALNHLPRFDRLSFPVSTLRADPNWEWGRKYGVYCFVRGVETVYVGRAVGKQLGHRIDAHLHRTEPEWVEVLADPKTRVEVFSTDKEWRFAAAALEVFLIEKLDHHPALNKQLV